MSINEEQRILNIFQRFIGRWALALIASVLATVGGIGWAAATWVASVKHEVEVSRIVMMQEFKQQGDKLDATRAALDRKTERDVVIYQEYWAWRVALQREVDINTGYAMAAILGAT